MESLSLRSHLLLLAPEGRDAKMMRSLLVLALGSASALTPTAPLPARAALVRGRAAPIRLAQRFDDPILDESIPDPVFAEKTPYKGRVSYGFSTAAEKLNGRAAMMGFSIAYVQEAIAGKGVLEQYGLPYDEGAVLIKGGGGLPSIIAVIFAAIVVAGLTYGGEKAYLTLNPNYKGTKLPDPTSLGMPKLPDVPNPFGDK